MAYGISDTWPFFISSVAPLRDDKSWEMSQINHLLGKADWRALLQCVDEDWTRGVGLGDYVFL